MVLTVPIAPAAPVWLPPGPDVLKLVHRQMYTVATTSSPQSTTHRGNGLHVGCVIIYTFSLPSSSGSECLLIVNGK